MLTHPAVLAEWFGCSALTAQDYKGTLETSLQSMGLRLTCLEEKQHGRVVLCVGRGHGERLLGAHMPAGSLRGCIRWVSEG